MFSLIKHPVGHEFLGSEIQIFRNPNALLIMHFIKLNTQRGMTEFLYKSQIKATHC